MKNIINKRKLCNKHGLYNAIEHTSCPKCKQQSNKTYDKTIRAKDRAKIYNSKEWKEVREKVLIRDGMMCKICEKNKISTLADEVHHIKYLEDRPDLAFELDNLISVCRACHMGIHAKDKKRKRNE